MSRSDPKGGIPPLAWMPEEWEAWADSQKLPAYRGRQVFRWVHQKLVFYPAGMTDLPAPIRKRVSKMALEPPFRVIQAHASSDKTQKLLLRLRDGEDIDDGPATPGPGTAAAQLRDIETVLIPQLRDQDPDVDEDAREVLPGRVPGERVTQCISSQVGCAMGCVFCASGLAGLKRSLTADEIVGQVLLGRARLREAEFGHLTNVVFMGMGEPLHNYAAVSRALSLLTEPTGLNLSYRRVTVSTSGLVPEIDRLGKDFGGKVQLAISLHSAFDERRSELMPINRKYPLKVLMEALRRYPLPKRRRITIEYTLISGVNDSDADVRALANLLRRIPVKVNLIPMNPVAESPLTGTDMRASKAFQQALKARGLSCFIRTQRGDDIAAACGQLALKTPDGARAPVKIKRRRPKRNDG